MYKKFFYCACAASMMLFTACQDDLEQGLKDGESVVTFNAELPSNLQSRTFADGKTATNLTYAVYEAGQNTPLIVDSTSVKFSDLKATVQLRLVNGKSYDILFWADNENAPYSFDANAKTVTVNYNGIAANAENCDAFFVAEKALTVDGTINKDVKLTRPFAQLNIGATDATQAATAGFTTSQTSVKVANIYSTVNLYTGEVTGETEVTYAMSNKPSGETFPATVTAEYLAMNYLLVDDKKLIDVEFTASNGSHEVVRNYSNVPVQRNYQTNIYGNILTEQTNFNVEIVPAFTGDYVVEVWDGKTVSEPATDADGNYLIAKASEWAWFANNSQSNKNIKITNTLDFGGNKVKSAILDACTIDGQGNVMQNLVITPGANQSPYSVGLLRFEVATAQTTTVENLTIETAQASVSDPGQGYAGIIVGDIQNSATLTLNNVHVINAKVSGVQSVAGLVGFVAAGTTLNINNCSVEDSEISNLAVVNESGYVAGLVGRPVGTVNVTNSAVKNTVITGYWATRRGEASIATAVGDKGDAGCTIENVQVFKSEVKSAPAKVVTVAELQEILNAFGASGAGDNIVEINEDLVLAEGETWTPVDIKGYTGAGVITIDGKGHKIKGLNAALLAGGFAGKSGAIIKNLTIEDATMAPTSTSQGYGAFVACSDSQETLQLINCHLINSTITVTTDCRVGGLIGWHSGYGVLTDGPVTQNVVIKDCSVEGCTISAPGSVGAITGHSGASTGESCIVNISNCTVKDNKLTCTKENESWRVGVVTGTVNGCQMTISSITESGNTLSQASGVTKPEGQSNLYGRFSPTENASLTIDGVKI